MKAKLKNGDHLLFNEGYSNNWNNLKDEIIINFLDKNTYLSFKQFKNHLIVSTTNGNIDIVFTGENPELEFNSYCKDQLILNIKKSN